jgi:hypothetical protein
LRAEVESIASIPCFSLSNHRFADVLLIGAGFVNRVRDSVPSINVLNSFHPKFETISMKISPYRKRSDILNVPEQKEKIL